MRAVVRQREVLLTEQASWAQRMQKALVQMNLQLTEVLSDIMDMTGQGRRSSAQSWGGECDRRRHQPELGGRRRDLAAGSGWSSTCSGDSRTALASI